MSNHEPKEEIYRGVSTLDEPSAKWGWHGISKSAMQKAGWISVIFLLGMTIGNHKGNVENWWLVVIAALIVIGLWFAPGPMINGFNKFGTGVTVVITVLTAIAVFQQITGIMFPVFDVMSTVDPDLGMTPLNNGLLVCGQIGIVLIGAFPMVEWITRTFGGALSKLGGALGMNDKGSAGLVATLANNIAMFNIMGEMNPKGKILNVAFAVSAAFVFGDHLGFAAGNDAQMIFPMIAGKLVAGVTALIVANLLAPKLLSKIQTISK